MATNPDCKFTDFSLPISGTQTITGIHYFPPVQQNALTYRPLIILLHGSTCTAHTFDLTPALTASTTAENLSVPVIAINRPGYLGSTPLPPPAGDSTFHQDLGRFYHNDLFPLLWKTYGIVQKCTALVAYAHSMGAPGTIIAAALHAQDSNPKYLLAGIIFHGWGIRPSPNMIPHPRHPEEKLPWKRQIMLGKPELNLASSEAQDALEKQDQPMAEGEMTEQRDGTLKEYWREYSEQVVVPVMYALAEHDLFFEGTQEHLVEIKDSFPRARRFDGSVVLGAPHAIEASWMSSGWYARCFGFAVEVAVALGI